MIQFTRLKARDCFAYRNLDFTFEQGLHSIQGMNGASKTSIMLTLQQGLFNRNSSGSKIEEVYNIVTGQPYDIEVEFLADGLPYRVINSRKKGTIEIWQGNEDLSLKRIPDNLKRIEEILGVDFQTFCDLTYQSKNSSLNILDSSTNKGRVEFVNNILKLSELDGHFNRLDTLRKELEGKTGKIQFLTKTIETLKASLGRVAEVPVLKVGTHLQESMDDLTRQLDLQLDMRAPLRVSEEKFVVELKEIESAKIKLEELRNLKAELSCITLPAKTQEVLQVEFDKLLTEHTERELTQTSAINELQTFHKALKKGDCPTCGHTVASDILMAHIVELEAAISANSEAIQSCKSGLAKRKLDLNSWKTFTELKQKIALLEAGCPEVKDSSSCKTNLAECRETLKILESSIQALRSRIVEQHKALNEITEHNAKAKAARELNKMVLARNADIEKQIADHEAQLKESYRRLDLIKTWLGILGAKGYRTTKIAKFLKTLNRTMQKYADILCDGRIKCRFFLTEEGEIGFEIVDAFKTMPLALWSGGETSRIKLVCLFSVLELLEERGSCCFNVLCLDEVFETLDSEGKEGLFKGLDYIKDKGKALYTITHYNLALDLVYDSVIKARKLADGTTEIVQ